MPMELHLNKHAILHPHLVICDCTARCITKDSGPRKRKAVDGNRSGSSGM